MAETAARIRTVIVDDEELARAVLREFLANHAEVEIVAECANGFEAVKAVAELSPDLLLLDVQMPKLDGFEVLELVGRDVAVIFVTAYDEFALRAFDVHAVDYLLKPFSAERLAEALERAGRRLGERSEMPVAALVAASRPAGRHADRVVVRDGARVHVVPVEQIDYARAEDDYVSLHASGNSLLKEQTLAELEAALDPARFIRIHRSFILNLDRLVRVEPCGKDSRVAVLTDGSRLPVSRSGYARLAQLLKS